MTTAIADYFEQWEELARTNGNGQVGPERMGRLLNEHGRDFESVKWTSWRGRGFRRGRVKECYRNALHLALAHDLLYVEGYAYCGPFPMEHAWAAEPDGVVAIDPTWRDNLEGALPVEQWEYRGLAMSPEAAFRIVANARHQTYGVMDKLVLRDGELSPPGELTWKEVLT